IRCSRKIFEHTTSRLTRRGPFGCRRTRFKRDVGGGTALAKAPNRPALQREVVMSKTAADQIVEMMIEVGIQRVYGLVGDSINPLPDAIRRPRGKLRGGHCEN